MTLQQDWGGPFPTFCFCFLCKKLDAFTPVAFCAFRTNLQHSSVWHSVNKKGRMRIGKETFPLGLLHEAHELRAARVTPGRPCSAPREPQVPGLQALTGLLLSVWGESLKGFLPKESSSAWHVPWSQTGSQVTRVYSGCAVKKKSQVKS